MNINLPVSIIEILNNSEYRGNYFISEYEQDKIISLYMFSIKVIKSSP